MTTVGISRLAEVLGVDGHVLDGWLTTFAEAFNGAATPAENVERQFTSAEIAAAFCIADYSSLGESYAEISERLAREEHLEECYTGLALRNMPIFHEIPDEIDDTWQHGIFVGGMARRSWLQLARSYRKAADNLVAEALQSEELHEYGSPIIFLYRHCLELYLKTILGGKVRGHDLGRLIRRLEKECGSQLEGWIRDRLYDFHDIDTKSDVFRYPENLGDSELWIDLHQLRAIIRQVTEAIEQYLVSGQQAGESDTVETW